MQLLITTPLPLPQVPVPNTEFAQLVHYNACPKHGDPTCAFYRRHSDWIDGDIHLVQGVRLYTMFMYLNDVPEDGGGNSPSNPKGGGPCYGHRCSRVTQTNRITARTTRR